MGSLALAQYGFAPALASALLHSLWQVALLAAAARLVLGAMSRAKAASRHNIAMAFLVAMVAAPAAQFLRAWHGSAAGWDDVLIPVIAPSGLAEGGDGIVAQSSPLAMALAAVWLAGVAVMLVRHTGGLRAVRAMERAPCSALPEEWRPRFEILRARLGIAREVAVRVSDDLLAPCAARLLRPVIWLPAALLARSPFAQVEALLAHELAHVARKDWLWNGVQCVIESLLFYHPAMWWLGRRIRQEREHACDDLAVAACGDPIALAEALASLERERRRPSQLVLAAQGGSLMHRISRLLSAPPAPARRGALALLAALALATILLVAQIALGGGHLPELEVRASTRGPLGPGDYREISANGLDKRRFYRASVDARGRLSETYLENGLARPIDADVRLWMARVSRTSIEPPPPPAPDANLTAKVDALVALVAQQPAVIARLGPHSAPTGRPVNGNVRIVDGADGEADIRIEMRGPRGLATIAVEAGLHDHRWTLRRVEPS